MNFDRIIHIFLDEALALNKENKSCHIAILLQGSKIISHGFNQMDRQCFRGKGITSLHAEIDCLRKCRPKKDLLKRNYSLLIVKITRAKTINNTNIYTDSRPCDCCTKYIIGLGFKHIYCSTQDGLIEKIKLDNYVPFKITYALNNSNSNVPKQYKFY